MWSVCSSLQLNLVPPWKHKIKLLNHASKSTRFIINSPPFLHITTSFSKDNDSPATPDQNQLGYDPSAELFGLDVDMPPSSPLKVKEDDEVDNLELNLNARKKMKRVYRSTPPEVGLKISRSLKSLNARTGLFSNRMKIIHRDPALHAQRVAAIKKAKGTTAARKHTSETLKKFFSDPENRRKRSISMKGVRFFCKNCGLEGHRSNYCHEPVENTDRGFKCGLCHEKGHYRRTCGKPKTIIVKKRILGKYHCRICGKDGHNSRTCSLKTELQSHSDAYVRRGYLESSNGHVRKHLRRCSVCGKVGHNRTTCTLKTQSNSADRDDSGFLANSKGEYRGFLKESEGHVHKHHRCSICRKVGHNRRTCSLKTENRG